MRRLRLMIYRCMIAMTIAMTIVATLGFSGVTGAQVEPGEFDDAATEAIYRDLIDELRCLVCANQSLAASNSALAVDLRAKIRQMLAAGNSRQHVIAYMVERYGDYILYKPPFKHSTLILWCAPIVILLLTLWLALRSRNRNKDSVDRFSESDRLRARALLADASLSDQSPPEQ